MDFHDKPLASFLAKSLTLPVNQVLQENLQVISKAGKIEVLRMLDSLRGVLYFLFVEFLFAENAHAMRGGGVADV